MKIDDALREVLLKSDGVAKGKTDAVSTVAAQVGEQLGEQALDADFAFPDLLQAFSRMLNRRQQLSENLPAEVKNYLSGNLRAGQESGAAVVNRPEIQQGISTLVRDSRATMDTLRQVASELEFVDRVPDLATVFTTASVGKTAAQAEKTLISNTLQDFGFLTAGDAGDGMIATAILGENKAQGIFSGQKFQSAVDAALEKLVGEYNSVNSSEKAPQTPAAALTALVARAIAAGTVSEELNRWITVADVVIGNLAE